MSKKLRELVERWRIGAHHYVGDGESTSVGYDPTMLKCADELEAALAYPEPVPADEGECETAVPLVPVQAGERFAGKHGPLAKFKKGAVAAAIEECAKVADDEFASCQHAAEKWHSDSGVVQGMAARRIADNIRALPADTSALQRVRDEATVKALRWVLDNCSGGGDWRRKCSHKIDETVAALARLGQKEALHDQD